jgi:hypothetical protein
MHTAGGVEQAAESRCALEHSTDEEAQQMAQGIGEALLGLRTADG